MSSKGLLLEDIYGRRIHINEFAGVMCITPIVEKIGDTISIDRNQAYLLKLWLKEHLK